MANVTFNNTTIRPRGDTASNWSSANPILAKNEVGYDETNKKFKIGDGITPWNSLPYCNVAPGNSGVYYVEGTGTTEGTWTGSSSDITSYYDGLIVAYKLNIAGASTTTLNINNLGAKTVYLRGDTKLTTHYAVNTVILAVYTTVSGVGRWYVNDYDANSYAYVRQYKTTTSADYPMLLAYETTLPSSYDTKYTRKNSTITANPSTGTITATKFNGTATKAVADENGNNIADTYALKSEIPEESAVNLEPIIIEGTITGSGSNLTVNDLIITQENYQQFLQNKMAPVTVSISAITFQVDQYYEGDLVYYSHIFGTHKLLFAIQWSVDDSYIDDCYTEDVGESVNLEPIKIGGTITGWENDFSIDNVEITEEHYNQFVKNKYAPISFKSDDNIDEYIFTLFCFEDFGNNNAYCFYEHIQEVKRYIICIEWDSGDGIIDDVYYEELNARISYTPTLTEGTKIGTITINGANTDLYAPEGGGSSVNLEPIDLGGWLNINGGSFTLDGAKVIDEHYTQFLQNKIAPIKIGDSILQMDSLTDEGSNNYYAQYVFSTNTHRYYVAICWYSDDLCIDETCSEEIGSSSGGLIKHIITSGMLDFNNPSITLTVADNTGAMNADVIQCSFGMEGLGTSTVLLYKCSHGSDGCIGFTDALIVLQGQRFWVRYPYLNTNTRVLTFTPDA